MWDQGEDPFDFSVYMDKVRPKCCKERILLSRVAQAPLTVNINSPLELVQQFFVKLGARYVVVTDADGYCAFLSFLDCAILI
jgi:chloride channel 3/4/5